MLNLSLAAIANEAAPISITEHAKVPGTNLSRVVIVCSPSTGRDALASGIQRVLANKGAPVLASFRWISDSAMTGFVAPSSEVIEADTKVLASFRLVSKANNLYMRPDEDGLWELKNGAGGKYLSKTAPDDLEDIIESVRASRAGAPRLSQIKLNASADSSLGHKLVAFVHNSDNMSRPCTDYGFCVGLKANKYLIQTPDTIVPVSSQQIIAHYEVDQTEIAEIVARANRLTASLPDKQTVVDYYKKLYSYDPDYLSKVIKTIEEQAAL